jgi:hypothetical protein
MVSRLQLWKMCATSWTTKSAKGAREQNGVGLGQRLVGQSLSQSPDRLDQRTAKVVVGAVRALHEAAGPGRVTWIAHASPEVPFDLVVDGGLGLCHLDTSIIRIEIQLPGVDAFSKPGRLSNWTCSGPGGGRGVFCAFVWRCSPEPGDPPAKSGRP